MFVFFSFPCPVFAIFVRPLHFYISLRNLQIALVTDFPRVIIITSVLFGRSKAAYRLRWYKRYVTKIFCIYRKLFRNRSQRTVSLTLILQTWTYRNGMCIIMDVREGNFNEKTLFSKGERLIRCCSNCWKLKLRIKINWFSVVKLREARDRPIHHDPDWKIGNQKIKDR